MDPFLQSVTSHLSGLDDKDLTRTLSKLVRLKIGKESCDIELPKTEVWKKCYDVEPFVNYQRLLNNMPGTLEALNSCLPRPWSVAEVKLGGDQAYLKLDRSSLFNYFIPHVLRHGITFKSDSRKRVKIVNHEMNHNQSPSFSQLSELRSNQVCQLLKKVYSAMGHEIVGADNSEVDFRLHVGCADPKYLEALGGQIGFVLKVGPVVDSRTRKKDFDRTLESIYSEIFQNCLEISSERQTASGFPLSDVDRATSAELQFQMLSGSVGQPVAIQTDCQNSDSSFVLYNYARIVQLINSFKKSVSKNEYPPIPDEVDYSVLIEMEEWEIFINFILLYQETIASITQEDHKGIFRLNKVCQLLVGLAKAFSRYYNRVRILREPLSHFLPTIFARMNLLKAILMTFDHALKLLDISPILRM